MTILSILFFITAILYSSVGFGGGSTYLALLLIWDTPYYIFPIIALCCNIIVVSGNCFNYSRAGNLKIKLVVPYLITSVPLAYIGGSIQIEKHIFELILFFVLFIAGIILLMNFKTYDDNEQNYKKIPLLISLPVGGFIGFLSGIVGIGGGIFLSPILFLMRASRPKFIVTSASVFILINSISGIMGQFTKTQVVNEIGNYWYLFLIVLLGGLIGNFINLKFIPTRILAFITSCLVIFVSLRVGFKIL